MKKSPKDISQSCSFVVIKALIIVLLGSIVTAQQCNYQQSICECDPGQTECYFTFVTEKMVSFTSYKLTKAKSGTLIDTINAPSTSYFFNNDGILQPKDNVTEDPGVCSVYNEHFVDYDCSIPMTTDSTEEAVIKTINGLLPGPTLVVSHNQTIVIDVTNNLPGEELSIHWHGMHQNSTPWMDGVGHISQCPIPSFSTFRYIFKAVPSGTMWYHSHTGTQRIEGIFGSLIVRESDDLMNRVEIVLQDMIGEEFEILNEPRHTLSFLDWPMLSADVTLNLLTVTIPGFPLSSGLMNGIGRELEVPYVRSRLSIFNVQYRDEDHPLYYHFRLVGAQNFYSYRFSIAEHKLIVIATDGKFIEPIEVDHITFHSGERYDFLLKPKTEAEANGRSEFLILAETVLLPLKNIAEGIIHYGTDEDQPSSARYEEIVTSTVPRNCTQDSLCTEINCPFLEYPPEYFIRCIPVTQLRLLFETEDIPSNDITDKNEHILDFSLLLPERSASVSGRQFILPSGSLQTQPDDLASQNICQPGQLNCLDAPEQCSCTRVISLDERFATAQFVITSIGDGGIGPHSVHLHGHSFLVVGIFYGIYNSSNGTLIAVNPNVTCNDTGPRCSNPTWTSSRVDGGDVTSKTIRKDTVVLPPGGYVVIRFIADNPGYWYLHCHVESHITEGMALVVRELADFQNPLPKELAAQQCGNLNISVDEFNRLIL